MPNLNGTGPKGHGPKTGQKQGSCGNNTAQSDNTFFDGLGKGLKNKFGQGKGCGKGPRTGSGRNKNLNR